MEKIRTYDRSYANCVKRKNSQAKYRRRLREETLHHYGGKCSCCGESQFEFLAIDHVRGKGNEHRRSLGMLGGGINFVHWLKREGYPKGFRILCHNCNMAIGFWGTCPHKERKYK